jgi:VWFA-related protein
MRFKLVLLLVLAVCLAGSAQEPVDLSVDVDRVNVLFTVTAKGGKLITNLTQDDFTILEDGNPQKISNFSKESNLPLNIALLVDSSGSVWDKLRFEREAAARFFSYTLRPRQDKAFVMTFDTRVGLIQDYTDNPVTLQHALDRVIAGGSTSLYDGIAQAVKKLSGETGRRVIVVLSDGLDNSSHIDLGGALQAAQKNDVVIYAVSANRIENAFLQTPEIGDSNLRQLATETGGNALFPKRAQDLMRSFYMIGEELHAQYSLAYGPTNSRMDGTYRVIQILPSRKSYFVRCRHGYFAPKRSSG